MALGLFGERKLCAAGDPAMRSPTERSRAVARSRAPRRQHGDAVALAFGGSFHSEKSRTSSRTAHRECVPRLQSAQDHAHPIDEFVAVDPRGEIGDRADAQQHVRCGASGAQAYSIASVSDGICGSGFWKPRSLCR